VEQNFETTWRMAKVAGGIDATVKCIETVIATLLTFTLRSTAGKDMLIRDLAELARSVQAATSVSQGATFDERDVKFHRGQVPGSAGGDGGDAGGVGGGTVGRPERSDIG
jgi:hypothetical protein